MDLSEKYKLNMKFFNAFSLLTWRGSCAQTKINGKMFEKYVQKQIRK